MSSAAMNPLSPTSKDSTLTATTNHTGNLSKCGLKVLRMTSSTGSEPAPSHRVKFWFSAARKTAHLQLPLISSTRSWTRFQRQVTCPTRILSTRGRSSVEMERCMHMDTRTKVHISTPSKAKPGRRRCLSEQQKINLALLHVLSLVNNRLTSLF